MNFIFLIVGLFLLFMFISIIWTRKQRVKLAEPTSEIVISHYNEDLGWVDRLPFPNILIASKTRDPPYVTVNKGNEASIFLKYICENYHQLKDYTIFLHGHEHAWHQDGSIVTILPHAWKEMIQQKQLYRSLNVPLCGSILSNLHMDQIRTWYQEYLHEEMGPLEKHGDWTVGMQCCAQFIVHRSIIQRRSHQCYQRLLDWILTTELSNEVSGRFMEWTWELLWELRGERYSKSNESK